MNVIYGKKLKISPQKTALIISMMNQQMVETRSWEAIRRLTENE